MKLKAEQLAASLRRLAPVYLVSGDEPLLIEEAADAIREAARREGFTGREVHHVERGFDWAELAVSAQSLSLFAERRLVELRLTGAAAGQAGGRALKELIETPDADRVLVIVAGKLDRSAARAAWVGSAERHGVWVQVWPVEPGRLPAWLQSRMRSRGLRPDGDALALLASRVEGNLLAARQTIEKLALTCAPGEVSAADVTRCSADSARFDVFRLADAALSGDARRARRVLAGLQREGTEPVLISWALSREIRTLAELRRQWNGTAPLDGLLETARIWPRRRRLVGAALRRLSPAELARLLALSAETDLVIKGLRPGLPWLSIGRLVLGLAAPSHPLLMAGV